MSMLREYLKAHRRELALGSTLSALGTILSMALLVQISGMARHGVTDSAAELRAGVALIIAMFACNSIAQIHLARLTANTVANLRSDLSHRLLRLDFERTLGKGRELVSGTLVTDVSRISSFLLVLPPFFFNAVSVVFCLGFLISLSVNLFTLYGILMLIAVTVAVAINRTAAQIISRMRAAEEHLYVLFRTMVEGKKELTLNQARSQHFRQSVLARAIGDQRELGCEAQKWWGFGGSCSSAILFCAVFAVIYLGETRSLADPATVVQFVFIALYLLNPLNFLIGSAHNITAGITSLRHVAALGLMREGHDPSNSEQFAAPCKPTTWGSIALTGVGYVYPGVDGAFKLGPLDLKINRGELLFIVGGNGSGKSTLALLMCGLLSPTEGTIELDGSPIAGAEKLSRYRSLFSAVFFDFFVFSHVLTSRGEIAPDMAALAVLSKFRLHGKVDITQGKLSTVDLSQGQRRRIALSQAYLDDRDILLFDECAADQDQQFREYFYRELLTELKSAGKTVLVVTHDDRYFDMADRVVQLDKGRIVSMTSPPQTFSYEGG
jgi:cyclic peptide transporter